MGCWSMIMGFQPWKPWELHVSFAAVVQMIWDVSQRRWQFYRSRSCLITVPIGSMVLLYMVTFAINIPPMLAYIAYMDAMGYTIVYLCIYLCQSLVLGYLPGDKRSVPRWSERRLKGDNLRPGWWMIFEFENALRARDWQPYLDGGWLVALLKKNPVFKIHGGFLK